MRTGRMFHRDAQTFLVHLFGQGLEDERYVVEKYRSLASGEIEPVQAAQPGRRVKDKQRRTIASVSAVKQMRPSATNHRLYRAQPEGIRGPVLGVGAPPPCSPPATRAERGGWSCRSRTLRRSRRGIFATVSATPSASPVARAPAAADFPRARPQGLRQLRGE